MPLHGQDISRDINPLEAGLGGVVDMEKGDFVGRKVLREVANAGPSRVLRGLKMRDRAIPREDCVIQTAVGSGIVTSGSYSPTLKLGIAMALLPPSVASGDQVGVDIRGREWEAVVVDLPFYSRFSKGSVGDR
jgi:aminomethyltransferase